MILTNPNSFFICHFSSKNFRNDAFLKDIEGKQGLDLPHVDQVLCERYGLGIARDSDSAVHIPARLAILAIRNTNHGSTKLSAKISEEEKLTFYFDCIPIKTAKCQRPHLKMALEK